MDLYCKCFMFCISEPDQVEGLDVTPGSLATELDVSWTKPTTTPCPVDSYTVEYQLRNQDQCQTNDLPERFVTPAE